MARRVTAHGFTLIELLVVIAIISILSGIAISNFSEAQSRAKVARASADLRTLATAIEAYQVDHNRLPRMAHYRFYSDPSYDVILGQAVSALPSKVLSTPVAYTQNSYLLDPFVGHLDGIRVEERVYTYQDTGVYRERNPKSIFWPQALEHYGRWRLSSVGPDRTFDHGFSNSAQLPYDPTNGTISLGNIWYSQRHGAQPTMPFPALLGKH